MVGPLLTLPSPLCRTCVTARVAANIGEPENMVGFEDLGPDEQVGRVCSGIAGGCWCAACGLLRCSRPGCAPCDVSVPQPL